MSVEELKVLLKIDEAKVRHMNSPNWKPVGNRFIHDFEAYVPEPLQAIWNDLSEETRIVVYAIAQGIADNEEWD